MNLRHVSWIVCAIVACGTSSFAAAAESPTVHPAIQAAIDSPDRPEQDRKRDLNRHYGEMLEFFGVRPGQTLLELFAASGTTAEILARAVGSEGKVYAQNPAWFYERFPAGAKGMDERLANNRLPNVVRLDKPLNEMDLPAGTLDGAVANMVMHDFFWLSQDVPGVLKDVYTALKPGGWFGIVDHAAPVGTGARDALDRDNGPHRIDEEYVKKIMTEAGFVLETSSDALRNPEDDRTKPFFAPEMKDKDTDRFVLRFRKR